MIDICGEGFVLYGLEDGDLGLSEEVGIEGFVPVRRWRLACSSSLGEGSRCQGQLGNGSDESGPSGEPGETVLSVATATSMFSS